MIKGAIFDMDGTLIDSMQMWRTLPQRYLRRLGLEPREDVREKNKKRTFQGLVEELREYYGIDRSQEQVEREMMQEVAAFYAAEVEVKPGVLPALEALKQRGVRLCIATATDRSLALIALERCGLLDYFERLFCCSEVGAGKNDPAIFRQAMESLGTNRENTLIFEDAVYAIRTAKADGFRVAGVFDRFETAGEEVRRLSDFYVEDYRKLDEILGAFEKN